MNGLTDTSHIYNRDGVIQYNCKFFCMCGSITVIQFIQLLKCVILKKNTCMFVIENIIHLLEKKLNNTDLCCLSLLSKIVVAHSPL